MTGVQTCALPISDKDAGPDGDRRFVADDNARVRRHQRPGTVGPDDRLARPNAATPVIADRIRAFTTTVLSRRARRVTRAHQDYENPRYLADRHFVPIGYACSHDLAVVYRRSQVQDNGGRNTKCNGPEKIICIFIMLSN